MSSITSGSGQEDCNYTMKLGSMSTPEYLVVQCSTLYTFARGGLALEDNSFGVEAVSVLSRGSGIEIPLEGLSINRDKWETAQVREA